MQYSFYVTVADETRRQSAITGLESGSLTVEDLTHTTTTLTGIVRSGDHGYEVTVDWQGLSCGCKDFEYRGRERRAACKHLIAAMLVDQMQRGLPQAA